MMNILTPQKMKKDRTQTTINKAIKEIEHKILVYEQPAQNIQTLTDLKQEEDELIKESALSFNEWLVENCELNEDIWSYYGEDYSLEKLFEIFRNQFKPE